VLQRMTSRLRAPHSLVIAALVYVLSGCADTGNDTIVTAGKTMGTHYSVKAVFPGPIADELKAELPVRVKAQLDDVDSTFSTWNPSSELMRFNGRDAGESVEVSADFERLFRLAEEVYQASEGAFDPTAKALFDLWGFGAVKQDRAPTTNEVKATLAIIGFGNLDIGRTFTKKTPLTADLSAIAKGFGVDRVAELLEASESVGYMVEVGGEVRTFGRREGGESWRIGVEAPDPEDRRVHRAIEVGDIAIATSGDYRNYREENGKRISHLIDPSTGYPVDHKLASATVFHAECAVADAWATAMMVAGPDVGLALAKKWSLPVLFLVKDGDGFREVMSTRLKETFPKTFN